MTGEQRSETALKLGNGPREDWFCRCREVAPDRIGTVPVLRPASKAFCFVCFTKAPWVDSND